MLVVMVLVMIVLAVNGYWSGAGNDGADSELVKDRF